MIYMKKPNGSLKRSRARGKPNVNIGILILVFLFQYFLYVLLLYSKIIKKEVHFFMYSF